MTNSVRPDRRRPVSSAGAAARERRERRELLRPTRRRALLRRWMVLFVFLGILGLLYLVLFTSLLGVRTVQVNGTKGLTPDEVRAVAAVELGKPLIRLDTDEIVERVGKLPRVARVEVQRSWPSTVQILVTERTPVAFARGADGVHLVDATGVDFAVTTQEPVGLPSVEVPSLNAADPTTRAVVEVLGKMPRQLRDRVTGLSAKSAGSVQLTLLDGRIAKWGSPADSERKAMVLGALLTRPGKVYDVSAPDLPTVGN